MDDVRQQDATDVEPWEDWIRRCTHDVEARMKKLKLDDWTVMQRARKWRWARKAALAPISDWIAMAMRWDPTIDVKLHARRRRGRPKTRWTDDIVDYITTTTNLQATPDNNTNNSDDDDSNINDNNDATTIDRLTWTTLAEDEATWDKLEHGFSHRILQPAPPLPPDGTAHEGPALFVS
jgi:hypothetical protein